MFLHFCRPHELDPMRDIIELFNCAGDFADQTQRLTQSHSPKYTAKPPISLLRCRRFILHFLNPLLHLLASRPPLYLLLHPIRNLLLLLHQRATNTKGSCQTIFRIIPLNMIFIPNLPPLRRSHAIVKRKTSDHEDTE
jgi:hypothetical protein